MYPRTEPPFRADHVGSLLRPRSLVQARHDFAAGRIDAARLRAVEDEAIRDVVALQEDIGLRTATDGEFRRTSWHMDFIYRLGGVVRTDEELVVQFRNDEGTGQFIAAGLAVREPLHLDEPIFADDFRFLSEQVRTAMPKMTLPSPSMVLLRSGTAAVDRTVYPDLEQFWADLAAAYAEEIRALAAAGLPVPAARRHQPRLPQRSQPACRTWPSVATTPSTRTSATSAPSTPRSPTGPTGMRIAAHMCRGNFRSSWIAEGGYDYVAEELFGELDVDAFFCEFDDERSGGFAPLRFVPPGKQVVLGLVTTKRGRLEDPDVLKRRIEEAAKYVPLDQLCLSPQCGFSSTVEGNVLNPHQEVDKLRLVVQVAEDVWG